MQEPLLLRTDDLCVAHPFTHPWHVAVDHSCLVEMFRDLLWHLAQATAAGPLTDQQIHCYPDHIDYHKRIMFLDANYLCEGEALTVIGFFGNKRQQLTAEVVAAINQADAELTVRFCTFADLVCYYSILLPDSYNYANLVLLKRPEGIVAWNASPLHQHAARVLSPDFYSNVRIYQGSIDAGPIGERSLVLTSVKYWDFQSIPTWYAMRQLAAP
ncbi:MAG TPA: hypothetical protein P5121_22245 [Caldilineaceae bacterium]|nr:hypothetical protein [Caldilineaceae bacterium]